MTPVETFMATQTEVLRQILQMQQQIAQQDATETSNGS
jgi:hypothetical protein